MTEPRSRQSSPRYFSILLLFITVYTVFLNYPAGAEQVEITGYNGGNVEFEDEAAGKWGRFELLHDKTWRLTIYDWDGDLLEEYDYTYDFYEGTVIYFVNPDADAMSTQAQVDYEWQETIVQYAHRDDALFLNTYQQPSIIHGWNIGLVNFGCSELIMTAQDDWRLKDPATGSERELAESDRDEWSVYFDQGFYRVQIDYWLKKVFFEENQGSRRVEYPITAAGYNKFPFSYGVA